MSSQAEHILAQLAAVASERAKRAARPALRARVDGLKDYQQRRFARTYEDLLATPRYAAAARFFLDELYGPANFERRDAQFARVVPTLVRLFPQPVIDTVAHLGELHALSERLDTRMAAALAETAPLDAASYIRAWQATGEPEARAEQIELMLVVGRSLDRFVRNALIRHSLRMMRAPAAAAGLGELQVFLESGLAAFRAMNSATEFLATIEQRERSLAAALFAAAPDDPAAWQAALGRLP
ncbi:MAG: hypothetical protein JSR59_07130 [Proteobacteria bacterium]|nr:hypothetical protein [Pseudomonadota bacterium]